MKPLLYLAIKDVRLLLADKLGMFFVFVFPLGMALLLGSVSTPSRRHVRLAVAVVDEDQTKASRAFRDALERLGEVEIAEATRSNAIDLVRRGRRVAAVIIPRGFSDQAVPFASDPAVVELVFDPARGAESAMLRGMLMEAAAKVAQRQWQNPDRMRQFLARTRRQVERAGTEGQQPHAALLRLFDALDDTFDAMQALNQRTGSSAAARLDADRFLGVRIRSVDVSRFVVPSRRAHDQPKPRSPWDISFPSAMAWAMLAATAGFAVSLVQERRAGTLLRLRAAPIGTLHILAGKGAACFVTVLTVTAMLFAIGLIVGLQPRAPHLVLPACLSAATCYVGVMMFLAACGRTERAAAGIAWAANLTMAAIGGGMIPLAFMPPVLQAMSYLSPVRWTILALEGAIWRNFSAAEMVIPWLIQTVVGILGLVLGTILLRQRSVT